MKFDYQLLQPCVKGDRIAITISKDEYLVGLETCEQFAR